MDAIEKLTKGNTLEKGEELGTNVWEAAYNLRQVVVKEIRDFGKAAKEIEAYNRMDDDNNVLKLYSYLLPGGMVQLVLERAHCSLDEFLTKCFRGDNPSSMSFEEEYFINKLNINFVTRLGPVGKPSPFFFKIIRDILRGVESLREKKLAHGCLGPEKVMMIFEESGGKLSARANLSVRECSKLSENGNKDLFDLTKIIHLSATHGEPLVENRDGTVSLSCDLSADLTNLVTILLDTRPLCFLPSNHLCFWDALKRMHFVGQSSKKMHEFPPYIRDPTPEQNLQHSGYFAFLRWNKAELHGGTTDWKNTINTANLGLWDAVTKVPNPSMAAPANYDSTETKDLVRFIRNAYEHRDNRNIQNIIGNSPAAIEHFFRLHFPELLPGIYSLALNFWMYDDIFKSLIAAKD